MWFEGHCIDVFSEGIFRSVSLIDSAITLSVRAPIDKIYSKLLDAAETEGKLGEPRESFEMIHRNLNFKDVDVVIVPNQKDTRCKVVFSAKEVFKQKLMDEDYISDLSILLKDCPADKLPEYLEKYNSKDIGRNSKITARRVSQLFSKRGYSVVERKSNRRSRVNRLGQDCEVVTIRSNGRIKIITRAG